MRHDPPDPSRAMSSPQAPNPTRPRSIFERLWGSAYVLLCLTVFFWAANSIVGRAVSGLVPPMALTFWRWTLALLVMLPLAWPHLRRDWPQIRRSWKILLLLGLTGVATFPSFLYWALQYTTALNSVLLQAAIPPMVLLISFLVYGERTGRAQLAGVAVSLAGVLAIITKGHIASLLHLGLNAGDAAILVGIVLYAFYPPLLRRGPPIHPLSLVVCVLSVGAVVVLPFHLAEMVAGHVPVLTAPTLMAIGFVALFPSAAAYLFFNRGVALIGSGRAGQFVHLMPAFGAVLAVLLLHEQRHLFHLVGIALIGAGIGLAALGRKAPVLVEPATPEASDLPSPDN